MTFRKVKWQMIIVTVVAIVAIMLNNINNIILFNRENKTNGRYLLTQFTDGLANELNSTEILLSNISVEYAALLNQEDNDQRFFSKVEVIRQMEHLQPTMHYVDAFFCSVPLDKIYLFCLNPNRFNNIIPKMEQYLNNKEFMEGGSKVSFTWDLAEINNQPYLFYGKLYNGIFLGAWCDINRLLDEINDEMPSDSDVFIANLDGDIYTKKNNLRRNKKNLQVSSILSTSDRNVTFKMSEPLRIFEYIRFSHTLITLSLLGMVLVFINMLWTNRRMIAPVNAIVYAFKEVSNGNLDFHLELHTFTEEFCIIGSAFNNMVDEMKTLKIEQYNQKIETQNVELQYYQMQIEPHFYLNTINSIYSMAQIGELDSIKKMSVYLSKYMRYMFSRRSFYETVEEALSNAQNYISLQSLRNGREINCEIDMESELLRTKIPFMLIQTFIENAIKHAKEDISEELKIQITGKVIDEEGVFLLIKDNGKGYPYSLLNDIMEETYWEKEDAHIGLRNIYKRLLLLYGDQFEIRIWNDKGACIKIWLPKDGGREIEGFDS